MHLFSVAASSMSLPPTQPPPPVSVPPTLLTLNPNQTLSLDPPSQTAISQTLLPPTYFDIPPLPNHP